MVAGAENKKLWYEIRDLLLGQNNKKQDVTRALELASACLHPDAQWLAVFCAGKDVKTREEAKAVFLAQGNDDARALCFAALVDEDYDVEPRVCRSAEMGFAFAQAGMCYRTEGLAFFTFASRAAAQGERDGFYFLGLCYQNAYGCEKDLDKAKENFLLLHAVATAYYRIFGDARDFDERIGPANRPRRARPIINTEGAREGSDLK